MMWLAQSFFDANKSTPILVLFVGGVVVIYIVLRPFAKKKKDPMSRPPVRSGLSQQRSVERQMESLLVELSEMSRQMSAQLDTRAAKLEILIKEADDKLAELRDAKNQIERLPPRQVERPAARSNIEMPRDPYREPPRDREPSRDAYREPEPPAAPPPPEIDARHTEIYDLARDGQTAGQIAHALRRPVGEIELILALRPR